jgi:hypothetical protein
MQLAILCFIKVIIPQDQWYSQHTTQLWRTLTDARGCSDKRPRG